MKNCLMTFIESYLPHSRETVLSVANRSSALHHLYVDHKVWPNHIASYYVIILDTYISWVYLCQFIRSSVAWAFTSLTLLFWVNSLVEDTKSQSRSAGLRLFSPFWKGIDFAQQISRVLFFLSTNRVNYVFNLNWAFDQSKLNHVIQHWPGTKLLISARNQLTSSTTTTKKRYRKDILYSVCDIIALKKELQPTLDYNKRSIVTES